MRPQTLKGLLHAAMNSGDANLLVVGNGSEAPPLQSETKESKQVGAQFFTKVTGHQGHVVLAADLGLDVGGFGIDVASPLVVSRLTTRLPSQLGAGLPQTKVNDSHGLVLGEFQQSCWRQRALRSCSQRGFNEAAHCVVGIGVDAWVDCVPRHAPKRIEGGLGRALVFCEGYEEGSDFGVWVAQSAVIVSTGPTPHKQGSWGTAHIGSTSLFSEPASSANFHQSQRQVGRVDRTRI